jgi:hypothetical protein
MQNRLNRSARLKQTELHGVYSEVLRRLRMRVIAGDEFIPLQDTAGFVWKALQRVSLPSLKFIKC